jgi:hypothetical protein
MARTDHDTLVQRARGGLHVPHIYHRSAILCKFYSGRFEEKQLDDSIIKLSIRAVSTGFEPAICRKNAQLREWKVRIQSFAAIST